MALSFKIDEAGFTAENLETKCVINLDPAQGKITESHLTLTATVPGLSKEKFDELVADAEKNCPISKYHNFCGCYFSIIFLYNNRIELAG